MSQNFTVGLVDPVIKPVHGLDGHVGVNVHIHRSHAAEASGDVERDIITRATAWHPWPGAIRELHFAEPALRALGFGGESLVVEQDAHVAAGLALALGLTQPRGFLKHYRLEILILLQRAVQRRGVAPLVKHCADARVAAGNVMCEAVCVQAGEGAHGTRVWRLHQVGESHHGVPVGVGNHLNGVTLVLDGVTAAGSDELVEVKGFCLRPADGQRQALGDEYATTEHGQKTLFTISHLVGAAHGLVGEES